MLKQLCDAVSVVVVVVVPALLHHQLFRLDSRKRFVGGEGAHREEVSLVILSQLLKWQLELFVSCAPV